MSREFFDLSQADLDAEVASATRGLTLTQKSDQQVRNTFTNHKGKDLFASQVIAEAAKRELSRRGIGVS